MKQIFKFAFLIFNFSFLLPSLLGEGLGMRCCAQFTPVWTQTVNPSTNPDYPFAITADASGIYVAGMDNTTFDDKWRIEKRDLTTGNFIASFGTAGVILSSSTGNMANAIKADASAIYVAGNKGIQKRDLTTGALVAAFGTGGEIITGEYPRAIIVGATSIYAAGHYYVGDSQWYVEKRDKITGALDAVFGGGTGSVTIDPSGGNDYVFGITADASGIYMAGDGGINWRIEKRDLTTGALIAGFGLGGVITSSDAGSAYDIIANASGIYVAGYNYAAPFDTQWCIMKLDLTTGAPIAGFGTGGVVTSNPSIGGNDIAYAITADATGIYVAGSDGTGNGQWLIEKRDLTTGAIICSVTSNPSVTMDEARAITVDASGIYVAGVMGGSEYQWRIEKYSGCGISLPIQLLSFTASWLSDIQTDALLQWATASELNNSHFTLERSTNLQGFQNLAGLEWDPIATVPGAGNSSSTLYYQYIDNTLPEKTQIPPSGGGGAFYYRLKQTDFDGAFTYSNIEVLTRGSITVIDPAPNPIRDELNFTLLSAADGEINITFTDMLGQLVKNELRATHKGIQQIKIPLSLASGMYMLFVETSDGVERIQKEFVIK